MDHTDQQSPDWALFLPAMSSFIALLGKQRKGAAEIIVDSSLATYLYPLPARAK